MLFPSASLFLGGLVKKLGGSGQEKRRLGSRSGSRGRLPPGAFAHLLVDPPADVEFSKRRFFEKVKRKEKNQLETAPDPTDLSGPTSAGVFFAADHSTHDPS